MNFMGLSRKYLVDRPLTRAERSQQLKQTTRLNIEPHYQLSVVKMNSTFLESVDKWFGWKGALSCVAFVIIAMMAVFYAGMLQVTFTRQNINSQTDDLSVMVVVTLMMLPVAWLAVWTLLRESFAYTHYPIRFNRKTRKVHVFRPDGSAVSFNWRDVFFTLAEYPYKNEWEIRGHILAPDRETVIDTFALSYLGPVSAGSVDSGSRTYAADDYLHAHWEFIRRYMEEGPQKLLTQVQFCMPVDRERERARVSIERIFANLTGTPRVLYLVLVPLCLVIGLFRIFAMRTSKIPKWPADVEAACTIEHADPYAIDGTLDGKRKAIFPDAARAAGVLFDRCNTQRDAAG